MTKERAEELLREVDVGGKLLPPSLELLAEIERLQAIEVAAKKYVDAVCAERGGIKETAELMRLFP